MALDSWFQFRYKSVRAFKEESEAGMAPRSSLKCKKRPESAESSDKASGMNPDNARPCNEILVTLPAAPITTQWNQLNRENSSHYECSGTYPSLLGIEAKEQTQEFH